MTKKLTEQEKKDRRPTLRACTFCHSKHLQCSNTRPCLNCIKRKIAHECKDLVRKRAKYMMKSESADDEELKPNLAFLDHLQSELPSLTPSMAPPYRSASMEPAHTSISTLQEQNRDLPSSTLSNHTTFNLNFLNQEYMMLGDLISKPLSPLAMDYTVSAPLLDQAYFNDLETSGQDTRPFISLRNGEPETQSFAFGPVNDEKQYVSPLLSHHIYQTVQDIYSNRIIHFDYPLSYHSLTHFLKRRFALGENGAAKTKKTNNLVLILKLIASYRPTFISAHKSLFQPFDFQFLEMSFQRCLLDYENLSRLNASPTIIWRRTGEIVSISNDLVTLLGLSVSDVLLKRTFIMELMHDDESIVEYFRLFKSIAVGNLHLQIVTKCKLIKNHTGASDAKLAHVDYIEFCSVWTVKRDLFDLPMMVVGQFLPILAHEGIRSY